MPGGPPVDATAELNPLEYLIRELELEPPRPVHPRRAGRIAAFVVALLLILTASVAAKAVDKGDSELNQATGDTQAAAADAVDAPTGAPDVAAAYRGADWIAQENAKPGSLDWIIPDDSKMWEKIRGYASRTSIDDGGDFDLYVTTGAPTWKADAYRMGYYQGNGGRLIWSSGDQPGKVQAKAVVDPTTHMAEARWDPSVHVQTGADWPPGMYLIRLTSSDGGATFVPITIRDDASQAPLLVQSSVTTWQAYNGWGGANHYTGAGGESSTRARVISFDRPYGGNGSGEFFGREFEFAYFVERLGLDVTYWTDIDLHERSELALQHKAVISLGHDEYYSTAMRNGLERARDSGVNVAFFGANAIYRKIRLEDSPLGSSRHQVNYRVASEDPVNGKAPDEVTVSWRDAPSNRPESSLLGGMYECNPVKADMVIGDASAWLFEGSGLKNGDKLPNAVGNEYDRVMPESPTPDNIQVLAHSPVNCRGKKSFADATYYTASSGAGVIDVGTFWWIPPLKSECPNGPTTSTDCKIQKVVENILRDFSLGPAGDRHPSVNNLAQFGIRPGYTGKIEPPEQDSSSSPSTAAQKSTTTTASRSGSSSTTTAPRSTTTEPPSTSSSLITTTTGGP
jgi:hypothetical protein